VSGPRGSSTKEVTPGAAGLPAWRLLFKVCEIERFFLNIIHQQSWSYNSAPENCPSFLVVQNPIWTKVVDKKREVIQPG
jgi:hypothetical protein